ncbi:MULTISPECIES: hypothetical protein [Alcaligenaceae]|uniref:hypothetical protein n=1 Tax=Bordetella genomosp. 10 TaxID=1416804 RepID=UPI0015C5B958|nr:hypothetical protein [Bordetella genomosp. 10]
MTRILIASLLLPVFLLTGCVVERDHHDYDRRDRDWHHDHDAPPPPPPPSYRY